jgi:hypothetical protein
LRTALSLTALLAALTACGNQATATATPRSTATATAGPTESTTAQAPSLTAAPDTPAASAAPGSAPCGWAGAPPTRYSHVIWIWMENKRWSKVINNADAPYETQLAQQCGTATAWSDAGSQFNSEPNYVAATSGLAGSVLDPFHCDCKQGAANSYSGDNLFRQVRSAGGTERSYQESMPSNCFNAGSGSYAPKHNPALFYTSSEDREACLADDLAVPDLVSAGPFVTAVSNDTLPTFSFVTPNSCNDTHDCDVATGDQFLSGLLPLILNSRAYRSGNTAVILMWDEDTPIPNVVMAPSVKPGTVVTAPVSHYGALRATEEMLGLPLLGAAQSAVSLRSAFHI